MDQTTIYLGVDPSASDAQAVRNYVRDFFTPGLNVLVSFDTESSNNTMIEVGLVVFLCGSTPMSTWNLWRRFSACCEGASLDPNEDTNKHFWCKFPDQFERIVRNARPLESQIAILNALVDAMSVVSASLKFLARPAAYDFAVLKQAIESVGAKNPLGFGGTNKVICAGNAVAAHSRAFNVATPPSFETLMRRLGITPATHAACDDALSQAFVYIEIETQVTDVNAHLDRFFQGVPCDVETMKIRRMRLRALLSQETPEETELDKRRAPPTDEMRQNFATLLERLKQ